MRQVRFSPNAPYYGELGRDWMAYTSEICKFKESKYFGQEMIYVGSSLYPNRPGVTYRIGFSLKELFDNDWASFKETK